MKLIHLPAVVLALLPSAPVPQQAAAPSVPPAELMLDVESSPAGLVRVFSEGSRVRVAIESDGATREQRLDLGGVAANAVVRAAKVGPYFDRGLVVALAIESGEATSYRYLFSPEGAASGTTLSRDDLAATSSGWRLSEELFTSTGDPYRIVEARASGDNLEITFRRGWPNVGTPNADVDEKIFFDWCLSGRASMEHGPVMLFDVDLVNVPR